MKTTRRHGKPRARSQRARVCPRRQPIRARVVITVDGRGVARRLRRLGVRLEQFTREEIARVLAECVRVAGGARG